jgi:hypothetical protein
VQPLVVQFIPSILEAVSHKKKEVQTAAEQAGNAIIDILCPWAIRVVQGMLFAGAQETKWQVRSFIYFPTCSVAASGGSYIPRPQQRFRPSAKL